MTEQDLQSLSFHFVSHASFATEHTSTYACDTCDIGFCDHIPYRDGFRETEFNSNASRLEKTLSTK